MTTPKPTLWLVIPCYDEGSSGGDCLELMAPIFLDELRTLISDEAIASDSRILFVNDGSNDNTWDVISKLAAKDEHFLGISLSRNFGHQKALLAGLMEARAHCDVSISIDCDGQDDIHAIERMIGAYEEGFDVVYGVRESRDTDTAFKRASAEGFYKLLKRLGADVVFNHADYRLLSKRALDGLARFTESNLYLRGIVPLIGYPSTSVGYDRSERKAGSSHYPLKKMISLALDGVTSLSIKPIRIITGIGMLFSILSVLAIIWVVVDAFMGKTITGWASTMCAIGLIGGLQLLCLGVIGEYVGKIYLEVKERPRFIVSERTSPFPEDSPDPRTPE